MKFIDTDTGSIYKVREKDGLYRAARLRPDAKSWAFVASKRTPWRTEKTEAEADLLNFAINRNLKRLED